MTFRFSAGLALAAMLASTVGWNTATAAPLPGQSPAPGCTSILLSGFGTGSGSKCNITYQGAATDKDITILSVTGMPATTTLNFTFISDILVLDIGSIDLDGPAVIALSYLIEVNNPDYVITSVTLDSNVQPNTTITPGSTVTKAIFDGTGNAIDTLSSYNGATDSSISFSATAVRIDETFNIGGGQRMFDASNAFIQTRVPEPASLAVLGAGLLGLGMIRRRKAF